MVLNPGARIGPYEVVAPLGAGGMGEVYRASDARLGREVAIKILPDAFASDPERVTRFQREAQLLASLNHPNIAIVYGLEYGALVMELVEGPTLADRIAQGPLPLDETLPIARQIAEALEAAHDRGVVHRDLKPANIKITSEGQVKVLDFGLAKLVETGGASDVGQPGRLSMSPTLSVHGTYAGVILGTAAYMSPEQARGKPVDRRTDIWAFGCVLFEMVSGKQAFDAGETVSDAVAAILKNEPEWSALPADTPPYLRMLLRRCLQKDVRKRLPHIGLVRVELEDPPDLQANAGPGAAGTKSLPRRIRLASSFTAGALVGALAVGTLLYMRPATQDVRMMRTAILPPEDASWGTAANAVPGTRFSLSPDGRQLAFIASDGNARQRIWVQSLDSTGAQPLAGTDAAVDVKWSHDSRSLVFVANATLRKISASGGPSVALAEPASNWGLSWGAADVVLFTRPDGGPLFAVPAAGGAAVRVTAIDSEAGEVRHAHPFFLPDGRRFLFNAIGSKADVNEPRANYVGSLDAGEPGRRILEGGSNAQFAAGHLLFIRETTVMAQRFDPDRLELSGEPVPIAEQVQVGGQSGTNAAFTVSALGEMVFQAGSPALLSQLTWFDRAGQQLATLGDSADQMGPELSPDGARAIVSIRDPARPAGRDLWVYDIRRELRTRLTFDPGPEVFAAWSPDSSSVVFNSRRQQRYGIYRKAASGAGAEELLLADDFDNEPESISPDGNFIAYHTAGARGGDIWLLPLSPRAKSLPFARTPFNEARPQFSPDGRWVAYASAESGRWEIYVTSFPSGTGKWQVSAGGGHYPRWRRNGGEIYYLSPDNMLMAAVVAARPSGFEIARVQPLFAVRPRRITFQGFIQNMYDVSADGQRFLVNAVPDDPSSTPLTFLVNWPTLLSRP